jgi:hypothetical protein
MIAYRDIREGEEIELAFWRSASDNDRAPVLKGKATDKFVKDGGAPASTPSPTFDPNDIPF